ncbi:hypothetical protein LX15_006112 [Streptoalloteichus tenebrarius]|uniref:TIGR02444 family protein n=1 Tax=Streptoalloteichus tenebrarius (strain ATCC 17920 / DSM 40477 / JCM 4838 / CBS 697.72 / NBRC 16177 / NCIMB 11028 / NRRL B-12390 / A12253. 1 / ISP 5477) TaxID=1933 RepID=A0ABT1I3S6_STRSD|nr:hypothetical protein [Streptoalloteichus tenebrarius]MCP2262376.1 hypothetical protein [Streptoalloteichus tenebrarius]BFF00622.1 hypothetical protein GCM10020241_22970 [Streptoalloteichus tenebrarius]
MSRSDFYRRRHAVLAALDWTARHPGRPLPLADLPEIAAGFATRADLVRALHCRWLVLLAPKVELALDEAARRPDRDRVAAVADAWRHLASRERALRQALDAHETAEGEALRTAMAAEHRLLALATGLAEPDEPVEQITRIGADFLSLLRSTPAAPPRRRATVGALLRRLVSIG